MAFGAVYAMNLLFPFAVAAITMGVLITHEFGHYYSALLHDGDPCLPIIIPLGIGALGITRIRNLPQLSSRARRYVIAAGPIAGTLTAIALLPFAIVFGNKALVLTTLGVLAFEIYGGTLGSDGKKWRQEGPHYGTA